MVGRITSGGYGHTLKKVLALAYLDATDTKSKHYQAEILGQRYPAKIIDDSPYDPENKVQSI
jgi:dimethylglycine dehydrogenase